MATALTILAAEHPWRLDLSSLAAILAALGTGALAFFTWRLARDTRQLARETAEDVRAEWRPVILVWAGGLTISAAFDETTGAAVARLANVGHGPALNTSARVVSESSVESLSSGPHSLGTIAIDGQAGLTAPGLLFRDASGNESSRLSYTLEVHYEDLAGRAHATTIRFDDPEPGARVAPSQPNQPLVFVVEPSATKILVGRQAPG